jgi:Radical SAM superfamily
VTRWLELTADYRCNNACIGCFSVDQNGPSMSSREVAEALLAGRNMGARFLWLGGGEPTLRKDLFTTIARAKTAGYERIKLQTNGMLLSYPEFCDRLLKAGLSEVSFSIKGAGPETHDRLTQTPGCHALMVKGIAEARARAFELSGDLLIYAENAAELPEMVKRHAAHGLTHFDVWLFSAADRPELADRVPRISDVMPHLLAAMDAFPNITSLHTPACTVPESHHRALFFPAELELRVENPGGHGFMLEASPIEGGQYLASCARCRFRPRCGGLRADYLRIHGEGEFSPI